MSLSERTRRRVVAAPARRPAVKLQAIRVIFDRDEEPDVSYLDQKEFAERRGEYESGLFFFVRARAEAEVVVEEVVQTLTSGGLNGIESDSEDEYIEAIAGEEWAALRGILKTVGVPTSELPVEIDLKWVEWRI